MGIYLLQPNSKPSFAHTQRWGLDKNSLLYNNNPEIVLALNEGGGSSVIDLSGKGAGGDIINGATWGSGSDGTELQLRAASSQCVSFPDFTDLNYATEFTLGIWCRPKNITSDSALFSKALEPLFWLDDVAYVSGRTDTVSIIINGRRIEGTTGLVVAGEMAFYCVTFKGGEFIRIYRNEILDTDITSSIPSANGASGALFEMGRGNSFIYSNIDILRAFVNTTAFTSDQVAEINREFRQSFNKGFDLSTFGVVAGDVFITPAPVTAIASVVNPTVVLGSLNITPAPVEAVASTVDPTVVLGSLNITPAPVEVIASTVGPTVIEGGLTITPAPISAIASTIDPTVILGAIFITPAPASAIATTIAPTVVLGSLSITPAPVEAIASTVGPTVLISLMILEILTQSVKVVRSVKDRSNVIRKITNKVEVT